MTKDTVKKYALGTLEIFMFMPEGFTRFSDNREDAIHSFVFPMLFYPFAMVTYGISRHSLDPLLLFSHAVIFWMGFFAYLGMLCYAMSRSGKTDKLWRFINISNWFSLVGFLYLLPVFVAVIGFGQSVEPFSHYVLALIIANLFYKAYIISRTFVVPWELGAFFAVVSMMVSDAGYKLMQAVETYILA